MGSTQKDYSGKETRRMVQSVRHRLYNLPDIVMWVHNHHNITFRGIFAQGKKYESSRDSRS
jgi:hypothetical protein